MTLASAVRSVSGEAFPYLQYDRVGYEYGAPMKAKGKSKSEKKQLALSALTLLAFLFFLNILQNCLKEQADDQQMTMMMMAVTPRGALAQGRDPAVEDPTAQDPGGHQRTRRSAAPRDTGRKLLQLATRQQKFIADYKQSDGDVMNGLSQISDNERSDQRLKTESYRLYWNKNQLEQTGGVPVLKKPVKINKLIKSPILADVQGYKRVENKNPEIKSIEFETKRPSFNKVVDFKDFQEPEKRWENRWEEFVGDIGTPVMYQLQNGVLNTPRNRRSELAPPTVPSDQESGEGDPQAPTVSSLEQTTVAATPTAVVRQPGQYSNHRYTVPLDGSGLTPASHRPVPYRYRKRYPAYYPSRNTYGYQYSPYRRDEYGEYYPMSVVGQYQGAQDDEVGFNLVKFVWTMLSAFAKPIARLVPSFAKVGAGEAQCYDLLVCEVHRASALMGPTAEVLATSLSTFVTWMAPEVDRQGVLDAVSSGKGNSCQKQITECDQRSGGKSAMTMIAQIMELKLR